MTREEQPQVLSRCSPAAKTCAWRRPRGSPPSPLRAWQAWTSGCGRTARCRAARTASARCSWHHRRRRRPCRPLFPRPIPKRCRCGMDDGGYNRGGGGGCALGTVGSSVIECVMPCRTADGSRQAPHSATYIQTRVFSGSRQRVVLWHPGLHARGGITFVAAMAFGEMSASGEHCGEGGGKMGGWASFSHDRKKLGWRSVGRFEAPCWLVASVGKQRRPATAARRTAVPKLALRREHDVVMWQHVGRRGPQGGAADNCSKCWSKLPSDGRGCRCRRGTQRRVTAARRRQNREMASPLPRRRWWEREKESLWCARSQTSFLQQSRSSQKVAASKRCARQQGNQTRSKNRCERSLAWGKSCRQHGSRGSLLLRECHGARACRRTRKNANCLRLTNKGLKRATTKKPMAKRAFKTDLTQRTTLMAMTPMTRQSSKERTSSEHCLDLFATRTKRIPCTDVLWYVFTPGRAKTKNESSKPWPSTAAANSRSIVDSSGKQTHKTPGPWNKKGEGKGRRNTQTKKLNKTQEQKVPPPPPQNKKSPETENGEARPGGAGPGLEVGVRAASKFPLSVKGADRPPEAFQVRGERLAVAYTAGSCRSRGFCTRGAEGARKASRLSSHPKH